MKSAHLWLLVAAIGIVGLAVGFWFGVRTGANLGLMIDSAPRAAISLHHLNAIKVGNTTNAVIMLESDIDTALVWNHYLDEEPLRPLLAPLWGFNPDASSEYLTRLADYRKQHPSPLRPEAMEKAEPKSEEDRQFRAWLIEGAREQQAIIANMVNRYATKSPKPK
jgi:hypothetical protein